MMGFNVSEERMELLSSAIAFSVSDLLKGRDWFLELISNVVHIKGEYVLRTVCQRGLF